MKYIAVVSVVAGILLGLGCGGGEDEPEEAGIALGIDFQSETDVTGFSFVISRCDSGEIVAEGVEELEDLVLPGLIPEFHNRPFDERSRHLFSDHYTTVAPGCYDITVQPIDADGRDSSDCSAASKFGVEVEAGKSAEVMLISQCEGDNPGGLDVVAVLNHPPTLEEMDYEKYSLACQQVTVCARASDPEGDPLRFFWQQVDGPPLASPIDAMTVEKKGGVYCHGDCDSDSYERHVDAGGGAVTECVEIALGEPGDYLFRLEVVDLYWEEGRLVPIPGSSTALEFPMYAADHQRLHCVPEKKIREKK